MDEARRGAALTPAPGFASGHAGGLRQPGGGATFRAAVARDGRRASAHIRKAALFILVFVIGVLAGIAFAMLIMAK